MSAGVEFLDLKIHSRAMTSVRLQMTGLCKAFGATRALNGVDLLLRAGEVLALIGENGAGKSTLMKVLSGVHQPDTGSMQLNQRNYLPRDPLHARQQGIVMIYQELTLASDLTVAENIVLGLERRRAGIFVHAGERDAIAVQALKRLGCEDIQPSTRVGDLSIAQQQMVEIARALITTPQVLVFDEPTSSLTQADVRHLFDVIERLKSEGVAIVYISHFLEECRAVADSYVVVRDGVSVATGRMHNVTEKELIAHMIGRQVDDLYPRSHRQRGDLVCSVQHLSGVQAPDAANLDIYAGEVIGIFGLIGSGRTELLRCLFGLDVSTTGSVFYNGKNITAATPTQRWQYGIGLVSENRKEEGLYLDLTIAENLTSTKYAAYSKFGFLKAADQAAGTRYWIDCLAVKCRGPEQKIQALSGGNQQKIAIGRLLHHQCDVLLLDEPTRGIDVGSKARIYELIDQQAQAGKAVVVVSSYIPELLGICDSLAIMCRGRLSPVRSITEWNEHSIMAAAIGQDQSDAMTGNEG